jgi:hypothetical protein
MEEIKDHLGLKVEYVVTKNEHEILKEVARIKNHEELEQLISKLFQLKSPNNNIKYIREALNQL